MQQKKGKIRAAPTEPVSFKLSKWEFTLMHLSFEPKAFPLIVTEAHRDWNNSHVSKVIISLLAKMPAWKRRSNPSKSLHSCLPF